MKEVKKSKQTDKSNLIKWVDAKCKRMSDAFSELFKERLTDEASLHPIITEILSFDNDFDYTRYRDFSDGNEVIYCFRIYQSLMSKINRHTFFLPTKENFCMFMGWTSRTYQRMMIDSSDEVKEAMEVVNDYLVESMLSAGMQGKTSATLTKFRSQVAGEHGLSLVTEKEKSQQTKQTDTMLSKDELLKKLESFGLQNRQTDEARIETKKAT